MGWAGDAEGVVQHGWDFLQRHCFNADGSVITTVDLASGVRNTSFDLYDHAFALFGLSYAADTLENRDGIAEAALNCLEAMIASWKHPASGFEEAFPPIVPLRSNPHMHLFEAFLAWLENPSIKSLNAGCLASMNSANCAYHHSSRPITVLSVNIIITTGR